MAHGQVSKQQRREGSRRRARRARTRRLLVGAGGLLTGVGAIAVVVGLTVGDGADGSASGLSTDPEGWVLPAMGSTAETQEQVALADFAGQPTIVNFFASWCTACDAELPAFVAVTQDLGEVVDFVGVASQETGDPMFMPDRHGLDGLWPLAEDAGPDGSGLSRALGARGMPVTAFYDGEGVLLRRHVGALTEDSLRQTISELYGIERTTSTSPSAPSRSAVPS